MSIPILLKIVWKKVLEGAKAERVPERWQREQTPSEAPGQHT